MLMNWEDVLFEEYFGSNQMMSPPGIGFMVVVVIVFVVIVFIVVFFMLIN